MRKTGILACAMALVMAIAPEIAASAQPTVPFEHWKSSCKHPSVPAAYNGDVSRLNEAVALLVPRAYLAPDLSNPGFYRFTNTSQNITYPDDEYPLSPDAPFYNETRNAPRGRTGYLVAPNIVATASHSSFPAGSSGNFNPENFWVVFDVRSKLDASGNCVPFDPSAVPAANVYSAKPYNQAPIGNALIADTMTMYRIPWAGGGDTNAGVDYAAFYLDRAAPSSRRYLRMRLTGSPSTTDQFAMIGHPLRLPAKISYGPVYTHYSEMPGYPQYFAPVFNYYYVADGSSGSPVYNLDRDYVEIANAETRNCLFPHPPLPPPNPQYYVLVDECLNPTPPELLEMYKMNNGGIDFLSPYVPVPYARVSPLDDKVYKLPLGGSAPAPISYEVRASATEPSTTAISAYLATPPSGQPALLTVGSYATPLSPGSTASIAVTPSIPANVGCGIYNRTLTIADLSHGFADKINYRFEIGMTGFDVDQPGGQNLYAISQPPTPLGTSYTLTNTQPSSVSVAVTLSSPWLAFADPQSYLVALDPAGTPGATKTITVNLAPNAYSLPNGQHNFAVTFEGLGNCVAHPPIVMSGAFHKGLLKYSKLLGETVFPPTPPNSPFTDSFLVNQPFCVSEVKATFRSLYKGSSGAPWSIWTPNVRIFLKLARTTTQTSSQIWNLNSIPSGWTIPSEPGPDTSTIESLSVDPYLHVPPTGSGALGAFNGLSGKGTWSFQFYDDDIHSHNSGILDSWEMEIHGTPGCN